MKHCKSTSRRYLDINFTEGKRIPPYNFLQESKITVKVHVNLILLLARKKLQIIKEKAENLLFHINIKTSLAKMQLLNFFYHLLVKCSFYAQYMSTFSAAI